MSTEIEAKFIVSRRADVARIRSLSRLGTYSLLEERTQRVRDHYLDTPDRALLGAGYACRRRDSGDEQLITVKSTTASSGAVQSREELELMLPADAVAEGRTPSHWPAAAAREVVLGIIGDRELAEIFALRQDRYQRAVVDGVRRVGLLSLDAVRVRAGTSVHEWNELELELAADGTEADLAAMCGWVRATLGLRPAGTTKFHRAMELTSAAAGGSTRTRRGAHPPSGKSATLDGPADMPVGSLFDALGRMGYQARLRRRMADRLVFHDAHDGAFSRNGFTVTWSEATGLWRLAEDGRIVAEEAGAGSLLPMEGTFAAALGTIPEALPAVPLVDADLVESEYVCAGLGSQTLRLVVQQWDFRASLQPDAARILVRMTARGPATALAYFTSLARERLGFRPAQGPILEAALLLLGLAAPGAPVPESLRVSAADNVLEACAKVLKAEAWRMRANAPGAIRDLDPEFVHDLRVATRRARSALRLFSPAIGDEVGGRLRTELGWIARLLGAVRDLDVLTGRLDARVGLTASAAGFTTLLRERLRARRRQALAELVPALQSERFTQLLGLLEAPPAPDALPAPRAQALPAAAQPKATLPVTLFARARIDKGLTRLMAMASRDPALLTDAELHRIRIFFKRLRYSLEFFRPVLGKGTADLVAACTGFQDCLGLHQDARTAIRIFGELLDGIPAQERNEELLLSMGALIQVHRDVERFQRERFLDRWRTAEALGAQWKKLRASLAAVP